MSAEEFMLYPVFGSKIYAIFYCSDRKLVLLVIYLELPCFWFVFVVIIFCCSDRGVTSAGKFSKLDDTPRVAAGIGYNIF